MSARSPFDSTTILSTPAPASETPRGAARPSERTLKGGEPFGTRYHIIRALGVGGMGAVYHAWDTELAEAIAIKVIRPEVLADSAGASDIETRFKRELLLARQVSHRNVVRIHDLGNIDGIKFITMAYVEGTDLATLLKREGSLDIPRALRIMRAVLDGVRAAHAAGIVHRDLKPANIMIRNDGEALVMDFGIARSTVAPAATAAAVVPFPAGIGRVPAALPGATLHNAIVGTLHYMAPEQARGTDTDQRADVYSLGLILYDMIAGRYRADHAESAVAELESRMSASPPALKTIVPAVSQALSDVVARCLEPDRDRRFASADALMDTLARFDANGEPLRVKRVVGLPMVAAIVAVLVAAGGGLWWYQRQQIPAAPHDPVSVVIADLDNRTGDPTFDRTLEPMIKRALEGAGFITAYDRNGLRGLGARPRDRFDEAAAREVAVQHGLGVVIAGAIEPDGGGFRLSLRARQSVAGTETVTTQGRATTKDQVVDATMRLVERVRQALGDDSSASSQQFAMASLSASSFEVVRLYANAMAAQSANRFQEARDQAAKAVTSDPKFGIGYLVLAVSSRNLGRMDDSRKYLAEALSHLDGMTERERYQTRGYSYVVSGDYEQCVKEYSELLVRYPSDVAGRNQLALCLSSLRKMRPAMDAMREIVKVLPKQPLFRDNLALYANYASDFTTAEQEARQVEGQDAYATLALAFAQLGQGDFTGAKKTYEELAAMNGPGASFAASGLGDLASVEGRFSEAVRILRAGATADVTAKNPEAAAAKLVAAAYAELSQGRGRAAIDLATDALQQNAAIKIRFLAGRTFIEAGDADRARPLIDALGKEIFAEPRAYAKLLEGLAVLKQGDARQAAVLMRDANVMFDTWIGQFDLGRAALAAGATTQADSAFDACLNARRGEAIALFVDEEPTFAYWPQGYYYQGLVREALHNAGEAESFRRYLSLRAQSTADPLVKQIRDRLTEPRAGTRSSP